MRCDTGVPIVQPLEIMALAASVQAEERLRIE
jgi:hypothetical protein